MSRRSMKSLVPAVVAGLMLAAPAASFAESTPEYHVTRTVALGAPDRWDYVVFDPASGRVYVAHGDEVTVVDGKSGDIAGHVKGLPGGTHGVALVTSLGIGFTDDGEAGQAASFDLKSLSVKTRIKAAEDADAIAFDPTSGHVFVINGDTGTITVIDPKTSAVVATIQGGGKLEYAVPSGAGQLYVNGAGQKEVLRVDTRSNRVDARWPVPDCTSPHGLALDPATHRLFVSCLNNILTVVDSDSGKVVTKLPIGSGSDAVVFDPKRKLIFSSNGRDGTLSVIEERDAQTFVSLGSIKTTLSARTMGIDPATGRIYLAAADVDPSTTGQKRPAILPGSLKLLILDPAH
ncbi:MAG TPA: YncE family protein [Steroidobacteraceae bacterium]|nr:YncE family protein [Steroidobacteraceae bacterium]